MQQCTVPRGSFTYIVLHLFIPKFLYIHCCSIYLFHISFTAYLSYSVGNGDSREYTFVRRNDWQLSNMDISNLNQITKKIDDLEAVCAARANRRNFRNRSSVTTDNSDPDPLKMCRVMFYTLHIYIRTSSALKQII